MKTSQNGTLAHQNHFLCLARRALTSDLVVFTLQTLFPARIVGSSDQKGTTMARKPAPRTDLPKIVRFDGVTDSGEYGAATCPHCGADGRYVYHFTTEDGQRGGAMAGCIQLFPVSALADEHKRILERQKDRDKRSQKLASWDVAKLEAIDAVAAGTMSTADALTVVTRENDKRSRWLAKKGYRR